MDKFKQISLKKRMMIISITILVAVFATLIVLFQLTTSSLQKKNMESITFAGQEIGKNLEQILRGVQSGSETLADNALLLEYLEKEYSPGEELDKTRDMAAIRNNIFNSFHRMQSISQIKAIYNVKTDELFNFVGANTGDKQVVDTLLSMDITAKENLSRYIWYPLRQNFLQTSANSNPRQNNVIIGTRRIYSSKSMSYPYVQVFAIEEQTLFEAYENTQKQVNGEVFILSSRGELFSSSRLENVESGKPPEGLAELVLQREGNSFTAHVEGQEYFVNVYESSPNISLLTDGGWLAVLLVPKNYALREVQSLYAAIIITLVLCFLACGGMLLYLYKQFMNPISNLGEAMRRVDKGDLHAYVKCRDTNSETDQMLTRYNLMLKNINRSMEEQIKFELIKKKLDMQVMTNQINPHFLYNTLETIVWKAYGAGRKDIGDIAAALGKLYRLTVKGDTIWTSLGNEVEHVESYIAIQKARYENQFSYECRFDESLADVMVPKLILQPIVENVFLHALDEADKPVAIRLAIRKRGEAYVEIKILDNGPGMDGERLAAVREKVNSGVVNTSNYTDSSEDGSGIGLSNVAVRLRLYMGERETMQIHSKHGFGTRICLNLDISSSTEKFNHHN